MPTVNLTHFVFVDFENIPQVDLEKIRGQPVHATLLLGSQQKKVDADLFAKAVTLPDQVEVVQTKVGGPNALDLVLAARLGRAIERQPKGAFFIVSKDKDFDPLIAHLAADGINIVRLKSMAALPVHRPKLKARSTQQDIVDESYRELATLLGDPVSPGKPGTRKALLAGIKSMLGAGASPDAANRILQRLRADGVVTFDANANATYPPPATSRNG
ncbi:MAG TPA: PIN domain-containing protein [Candidatus Didemnitutus sp.]